ncbi:SUMF1/EgtB/PvdO family nonheme iron enzyme [bacterium]|nr:SUMF1/EgtB/PvdO family nonheme iron enzyme [bacterium]
MTDTTANYNEAANWNGRPPGGGGLFTTVGSAGSYSAYGTCDQTGNVMEWTETVFPGNGGRVRYGGHFYSPITDINYILSRYGQELTFAQSEMGFRVARW